MPHLQQIQYAQDVALLGHLVGREQLHGRELGGGRQLFVAAAERAQRADVLIEALSSSRKEQISNSKPKQQQQRKQVENQDKEHYGHYGN